MAISTRNILWIILCRAYNGVIYLHSVSSVHSWCSICINNLFYVFDILYTKFTCRNEKREDQMKWTSKRLTYFIISCINNLSTHTIWKSWNLRTETGELQVSAQDGAAGAAQLCAGFSFSEASLREARWKTVWFLIIMIMIIIGQYTTSLFFGGSGSMMHVPRTFLLKSLIQLAMTYQSKKKREIWAGMWLSLRRATCFSLLLLGPTCLRFLLRLFFSKHSLVFSLASP